MNAKLLLLPVLLLATHTNAASLASTFSTNDVTVSAGGMSVSGSNSNVDRITSDGSGFYLGYTSSF